MQRNPSTLLGFMLRSHCSAHGVGNLIASGLCRAPTPQKQKDSSDHEARYTKRDAANKNHEPNRRQDVRHPSLLVRSQQIEMRRAVDAVRPPAARIAAERNHHGLWVGAGGVELGLMRRCRLAVDIEPIE